MREVRGKKEERRFIEGDRGDHAVDFFRRHRAPRMYLACQLAFRVADTALFARRMRVLLSFGILQGWRDHLRYHGNTVYGTRDGYLNYVLRYERVTYHPRRRFLDATSRIHSTLL